MCEFTYALSLDVYVIDTLGNALQCLDLMFSQTHLRAKELATLQEYVRGLGAKVGLRCPRAPSSFLTGRSLTHTHTHTHTHTQYPRCPRDEFPRDPLYLAVTMIHATTTTTPIRLSVFPPLKPLLVPPHFVHVAMSQGVVAVTVGRGTAWQSVVAKHVGDEDRARVNKQLGAEPGDVLLLSVGPFLAAVNGRILGIFMFCGGMGVESSAYSYRLRVHPCMALISACHPCRRS